MWFLLSIAALSAISLQSDAKQCPTFHPSRLRPYYNQATQVWSMGVQYYESGNTLYNCIVKLSTMLTGGAEFDEFSRTTNPEYCSSADQWRCTMKLPPPTCEGNVVIPIEFKLETTACRQGKQCGVASAVYKLAEFITKHTCTENSVFKTCGGSHKTCKNALAVIMKTAGCFCKDGWLWDEKTKKCVVKSVICPGYHLSLSVPDCIVDGKSGDDAVISWNINSSRDYNFDLKDSQGNAVLPPTFPQRLSGKQPDENAFYKINSSKGVITMPNSLLYVETFTVSITDLAPTPTHKEVASFKVQKGKPVIDRGKPKPAAAVVLPTIADSLERDRKIKIGANKLVLPGYSFTIICGPVVTYCRSVPPYNITYTWYKDEAHLTTTVYNISAATTEASPCAPSTLTILVNTSDPGQAAGRYKCLAANEIGQDEAESNMRLGIEIVAPPVFLNQATGTDVVVINGSTIPTPCKLPMGNNVVISEVGKLTSLTFYCSLLTIGIPSANISWTVNGRSLINSRWFRSSLNVTNSTDNSTSRMLVNVSNFISSFLCCKAENIAGKDLLCSELKLPSAKSPTVLARQPSFTCGDESVPSYWIFPSQPVHAKFGCNHEVCIEKGEEVSLSLFTCASTPTLHPTTCTIYNPDGVPCTYLSYGSGVSFQTFGTNALLVKDALQLVNNDTKNLLLPVVLGRWLCVCENQDGSINSTIHVGPCLITPKIESGLTNSSINALPLEEDVTFKIGAVHPVLAGFSFAIVCRILQARPDPSVMWFRNGELLSNNTNQTTLRVHVSRSEPASAAGDYRCTAENEVDNDTAHSNMTLGKEILVLPRLLISKKHYENLLENSPVFFGDSSVVQRGKLITIYCSVVDAGIPQSELSWMDGQNLTSSKGVRWSDDNLTIETALVNATDLRYCCIARNEAGSDTACSNITIKGAYCGRECPGHSQLNRTNCECIAGTGDLILPIVGSVTAICVLLGSMTLCALLCRKRTLRRSNYVSKMVAGEEMVDISTVIRDLLASNVQELTLPLEEWELSHSDLEVYGLLGKGQFGNVKLALLDASCNTGRVKNYVDQKALTGESLSTCRTVAVKFLNNISALSSTNKALNMFAAEIIMMMKVSQTPHNHIVQFIGCVLSALPLAVVMEFVPFGDLRSNLMKWKVEAAVDQNAKSLPSSSESTDQSSSTDHDPYDCLYPKEALKSGDLFSFGHQIARGMSHLASLNVIHRDLACRNVLVGENKTLKVSDFGLSKEIDGVYTSTSKTKLPIRWMSPEAIHHRIFSQKSDVWSFGVCLWEICTLGEVPYSHLSSAEVAAALNRSSCLRKPSSCHDDVYSLMLNCWKRDAAERPAFEDIEKYLEDLITKNCHQNYMSLESFLPELEAHPEGVEK